MALLKHILEVVLVVALWAWLTSWGIAGPAGAVIAPQRAAAGVYGA